MNQIVKLRDALRAVGGLRAVAGALAIAWGLNALQGVVGARMEQIEDLDRAIAERTAELVAPEDEIERDRHDAEREQHEVPA